MVQILDQFGQPIKRELLAEPQTASLGWLNQQFAEHPSRGLTPQKLHNILVMAEQGDLSAQSDLFQDLEEKDAHIYAEMSKRKRALLTLDWSIVPPNDASAKEKRDAEELEAWLRDMDDLEDIMLDALDGIGHGFSAQTIQWGREEKFWLPQVVEHYPQRNFMTLPTNLNALRLRDGTTQGAELWPFAWILHTHKAKSGYLGRCGLHRVLSWPYLFKNYSVRDLAEFLEIYGIPIRMGKYPAGATKDERETLLRAVVGIGHNAAGIMPDGMAIEIQNAATGKEDPFLAMIEWAERSESKAILGGTLTTQADGKTSTNALGNVHNEVRQDLKVADARQLGGTLSRDLVFPLRALNQAGADPRRRFRFVFDTREIEDLQTMANALPKLVQVGVRIPESWARDKLAIPEPVDDEPVLALQARAAAPGAPTPEPGQADLSALFRAVLASGSGELDARLFPDQAALDAVQAPAALTTAVEEMLKPVIEFLQQGGDAGEALTQLAETFPKLDSAGLEEMLARAIFVADTWGRLNGETGNAG